MKKEWIFESTNSSEKSLIKRLLYSRGIKTEQEIHEFLHPLEMTLTSPNAFTDMEKAVNRLSKAIDEKETTSLFYKSKLIFKIFIFMIFSITVFI